MPDPAPLPAPQGSSLGGETAPAPDSPASSNTNTSPFLGLGKVPPWILAFGALSVVFAITVAVFWNKVTVRDQTLQENRNRSEQRDATMTRVLAEMDVVKAEAVKLQAAVNDAAAEFSDQRALLQLSKAETAALQDEMTALRKLSNGFQSQMEDAKVTSIRHQGAVEVAQAQTAVASAQRLQAREETTRLQAELGQARANAAVLQSKLQRAEEDLARKPLPPAKK